MPLTLAETNSLIAALGLKIPESLLEQKAKAEEFKARREKLTGEAAAKPADWRLKASFDDTLKRATQSAEQKQFGPAFKLLDAAAQMLRQPDAPPPPPAVAPEPATAPAAVAGDAVATASEKGFLEKWAAAKQVWLGCLETVDAQLEKVRAQMLATGDPDFKIIADRGLPALTDNHKTPVMKALFELESGAGAARKEAAQKATAAIATFRAHLDSFHLIRALDEHAKTAFGVSLTLRAEIGRGLGALEQALQTLAAS